MADIPILQDYGTDGVAITITVNSLASSATAGRQSTVVSNATDLFEDAFVQAKFTVPTGGTAANDKKIYVYVFGTADATNDVYPAERGVAGTQATLGASDAAFTMTDPATAGTPLYLLDTLEVPVTPTTTDATLIMNPKSVAAAFGGSMPKKWGVVVRNYCGITLKSTLNSMWYNGIKHKAAA